MKSIIIVLFVFSFYLRLNAQTQTEVKLIGLTDHGKDFEAFTYTPFGAISEEKSLYFYTGYHYDSQNRLTATDDFADPSTYNNDAAIAFAKKYVWMSPNTSDGLHADYKYDGNVVLLKSMRGTDSFYYRDKKGRIIKIEFLTQGILRNRLVFDYDKIGNVIREREYEIAVTGGSRLRKDTKYKFDKMHNPYFNFHLTTLPGKYTNPNNIISISIEGHTMEQTYQYNQQGYPISNSNGLEFRYN